MYKCKECGETTEGRDQNGRYIICLNCGTKVVSGDKVPEKKSTSTKKSSK